MRRFFAFFLLYCGVELVLLLLLADRTSWKVPVLLILSTGFFGAMVTRFVKDYLGQAIFARIMTGQFPWQELSDGAMIYIAGMLLMLPGVLGDLVGLLLLLPPVRWLIVVAIRRRYLPHSHELDELDDDGDVGPQQPPCKVIVLGENHVHPAD